MDKSTFSASYHRIFRSPALKGWVERNHSQLGGRSRLRAFGGQVRPFKLTLVNK